MIAVIEALRTEGRSLRPLDCSVPEHIDTLVPDAGIVDPEEPLSPDYFVSNYVPREGRRSGRRRLVIFLVVIAGLFALAAAWRWTPLHEWLAPQRLAGLIAAIPVGYRAIAAVAGFVIASLMMVPVTLLAVIGGVVFEDWQAYVYVLLGALVSAAAGFGAGRAVSRDTLDRMSGSRLEELSKRLAERGTVAVALLRLVPIAPFTVFNLVAGASHIGFRQFIVGSLLGLAPTLAAITLFSQSLWALLKSPSLAGIAAVLIIGGALALMTHLVRRWLRSG